MSDGDRQMSLDFRQSAYPASPRAKQVPLEREAHGDRRLDPYGWLRDEHYPDVRDAAVLACLEAENAYVEQVMGPAASRGDLLAELKSRIIEEEESVPYRFGPYLYYRRTVAGGQHTVHCRMAAEGADEEVVLDVNRLAEGHGYYRLGSWQPAPDHRLIAFAEDSDGSERWVIRIKDMATGDLLPDRIDNASTSLAWSADGAFLFYVRLDEHLRPKQVFRHALWTSVPDVLIYAESDARFFVGISQGLSGRFLYLRSAAKASSELYLIPADQPLARPRLVAPRREGHEYSATDRGDFLYIRTNDRHPNFRIVRAPLDAPAEARWQEVLAPSDGIYRQGMIGFARRLVVIEREGGLRRIRIACEGEGEDDLIAFPDPAYAVAPLDNADPGAAALRLSYESPGTPETVFDYDFATRLLVSRKVKAIPGVDAARYRVERRWAKARDGTEVPVTIVADKDVPRDGTAPVYLYGYGAYGHGLDPGFNADRVSLLARGFVVAIAHIRGGDELGRAWYDAGKLACKQNSFTDFIDVAQYLIAEGYSAPGRLVASGGSAGGLLIGAVLNMAPELFRAAIAKVPFVDVLTTMLDASLPLTATEFDEWGNPAEADAYWRIKSYSPVDNVGERAYPHLLVTAGLTDPRVTYWEPAKWVALLRAAKRDDHVLLLKTEMGAGHGGASGRYKRLEEVALEYAFLLRAFGMTSTSA